MEPRLLLETLGLPRLAAAALLAATLAGFFGSRSWILDLFSHFRPHYLAGLLLLAAVFGFGGDRWMTVLCAVGAAANLGVVAPFWFAGFGRSRGPAQSRRSERSRRPVRSRRLDGSASSATPVASGPAASGLSVCFLNVDWRRADPRAVLDYVDARDDDLVVLLAVSPRWVEAVGRAGLGLRAVAVLVERRAARVIALARDPGARATVHQPMPGTGWAAIEVELELEDRPLRVLATHARSPRSRERARLRDSQLAWIAGWAERRTDPVVVLGDLNATPWSHALRALETEAGLVNSLRGHGLQPTWPAWIGPFGIPIDHVLHGPELVTVQRTTGPSFGSDHRMVQARLAFAKWTTES